MLALGADAAGALQIKSFAKFGPWFLACHAGQKHAVRVQIGDDQPLPGMSVRQTTFSDVDQRRGISEIARNSPEGLATSPEASGPRNLGQNAPAGGVSDRSGVDASQVKSSSPSGQQRQANTIGVRPGYEANQQLSAERFGRRRR